MNDATLLIDQLQAKVNQCHTDWQALATWQAKNTAYQQALTHNRTSKKKVTVPANPGPLPAKPEQRRLRAVDRVRHSGLGAAERAVERHGAYAVKFGNHVTERQGER